MNGKKREDRMHRMNRIEAGFMIGKDSLRRLLQFGDVVIASASNIGITGGREGAAGRKPETDNRIRDLPTIESRFCI